MAAKATDLVAFRCARCDGTGQYYSFGVCYTCRGRRSVTITIAEWRTIRAEQARWNAHAKDRAAQRVEIIAQLDWTGSKPCPNCTGIKVRGRCAKCVDGQVPDLVRNPRLADFIGHR